MGQINMEFYASYVYMSMFTYFDRDDVAYPGLAAFFKKNSDEEREHGEKLIKYRTREEARSSSRTSPSPAPWSGEAPWTPLRLLLNLRRQSIRASLTCTRLLTVTLIFATSSRASSLTSRWTPSRRSPASSPSGRGPDRDLDITCSTRRSETKHDHCFAIIFDWLIGILTLQ